jgi:hypothetical protein
MADDVDRRTLAQQCAAADTALDRAIAQPDRVQLDTWSAAALPGDGNRPLVAGPRDDHVVARSEQPHPPRNIRIDFRCRCCALGSRR